MLKYLVAAIVITSAAPAVADDMPLGPADIFARVAVVESVCPKYIHVNAAAAKEEATGWRDTARDMLGESADGMMRNALEAASAEVENVGAAKWCVDFRERFGASQPIFK